MSKGKTYKTSIDIDAESREQIIALLNQQLADTFDLYSQTKQAHWNVKGQNFYQLHILFDKLAEMVFGNIDTIAERVTQLGGTALGTARMAAAASRLPEYPAIVDGHDTVKALVDRYATLADSTRHAIDASGALGDQDAADIFVQQSRDLDKALWFLEAHLQT